MPLSENLSYESRDISELLPDAFGPSDLDSEQRFMQDDNHVENLVLCDSLAPDSSDSALLIENTLAQANNSYAPYSRNYAACVIQTDDDQIYSGKSIENAAYNPSLPAFSAALVSLVMGQHKSKNIALAFQSVKKVVLVELISKASQQELSESLLKACCKDLQLESYQAQLLASDAKN
jgi:cytidine deaminase